MTAALSKLCLIRPTFSLWLKPVRRFTFLLFDCVGGKWIQIMSSHGSASHHWRHFQVGLHHIRRHWNLGPTRCGSVFLADFKKSCQLLPEVEVHGMWSLEKCGFKEAASSQLLLGVFAVGMEKSWTSITRPECLHYCTVCNLIVYIFSCCLFTVGSLLCQLFSSTWVRPSNVFMSESLCQKPVRLLPLCLQSYQSVVSHWIICQIVCS